MAIIEIIKRHAKSLFSVLLLTIFSPLTYAFELLSEGAMDSVSVRSGPIFDSRQSGSHRDEGYEQLPFDISQEASVTATDEVSLELDFVLVQEVESWANNVRDNVGALFEVSTIDALPGAEPFDLKIYLEHSGIETLDVIATREAITAILQMYMMRHVIRLLSSIRVISSVPLQLIQTLIKTAPRLEIPS